MAAAAVVLSGGGRQGAERVDQARPVRGVVLEQRPEFPLHEAGEATVVVVVVAAAAEWIMARLRAFEGIGIRDADVRHDGVIQRAINRHGV